MTRRLLPSWKPDNPPSATKLNRLSTEVGRITGLPTGGDEQFIDNASGRFVIPKSVVATATIIPMIVTEQGYGQYGAGYGYDGGEAAISRTSHATHGFSAKKVDADLAATGGDITVKTDMLVNVLHTGELFNAMLYKGSYYAVWTGNHLWTEAVTQEAFTSSGRVELYDGGAIVTAETDTPIADATFCDIEFDNQRQVYKVVRQRCPAEPDYVYGE